MIRRFVEDIPGHVDHETREHSEKTLDSVASTLRPDQLRKAADRLMALINPDGEYSDEDRASKRGITIGPRTPTE